MAITKHPIRRPKELAEAKGEAFLIEKQQNKKSVEEIRFQKTECQGKKQS